MDFYQLLVIFSFVFFLILMIIVIGEDDRVPETRISLKLIFFWPYLLLFFTVLVLSGYSAVTGFRSQAWFAIFTLYVVSSLFYSRSDKKAERDFAVTSVLLLSILVSTIPILQNNGVVFGPDQWRDLEITTTIANTGTFSSAIVSGYYSFIPLFNIINAALTVATGWEPMMAFTVTEVAYTTIAILSLYLVVEKLTNSREASLLSVIIFISTPRLATVQAIPAVASICLCTLLLMMMLELKANLLYVAPLISFTTTVLHPTGIIPVVAVSMGIISVGYVFVNYRLNAQTISYTSLYSTICILVTLIYWSIDTRILMGVFSPLQRLINIITNLEYIPSVYSPQYQEAGYEIFAYSWALPVSAAAAYFANFLLSERNKAESRNLTLTIGVASASMGLAIIMVSFLSILLSPGASLERYMNVPAYLLLTIPAAFLLKEVTFSHKKGFILIGLILISTNLYIGTKSPNWAPFENPTFGAYRSTYLGYIESNDIIETLPPGIRIYEDNDLPLYEVASMYDIPATRDRSYQTIRVVVQGFKDNEIDYSNQRIINSVTYLRINEITEPTMFDGPVNVVYNNGHVSGLRISIPQQR